jgi:hypothetical protein
MATTQEPLSTLYSPMLGIETLNSKGIAIYCTVVNASSAARNGSLYLYQADGTQIGFGDYSPLPPGAATGIVADGLHDDARVTLVYCKVTVDGAPELIRASLLFLDPLGNTVATVEAR